MADALRRAVPPGRFSIHWVCEAWQASAT
jgi:hypothetical protein